MRHPRELLFLAGVIEEVEPVTHRMRRIRIRIIGHDLRTTPWIPGQHVRINVTAPQRWLRHPRDARRTYSVRHLDQTRGAAVASQERCKWRRGAAPWWSMLGRVGGGLVDLAGVSSDRGGWVEELAA
jgi:hypothetical protein